MTYNKFSFICLFFISLFFTQICLANPKTGKTNLFLDNISSVCWYKNEKYTEGALLVMADKLFVCANKFDNETNGQLIWRIADDSGQAIPSKSQKSIRIN